MIKNIIFDLGGVILDVDYDKAVAAFAKLGVRHFHDIYSQQKQTTLFDQFETGTLSANDFRAFVKGLNPVLTDTSIDNAWNAMILETPPQRMNFLKKLSSSYALYLLSNTNEIHIQRFSDYFDHTFGKNYFNSLFKNIYLSSQLGMRKPEPEIFNYVIEQNNLQKNETVFIDDSAQHVSVALQTGMHALLLPKGEVIETFLLDALSQIENYK